LTFSNLAAAESAATSAGSGTPLWRKTSRNLVIVRAGDSSLHEEWLAEPGERNWDLVVSYFGDDPLRYRGENIIRLDSKGPKWSSLYQLICQRQAEIMQYDYIWLPDDDLSAAKPVINRMFAICAGLQMELAQPALTPDSHIALPITLVNTAFAVRYTNFVEIMAPVFSRAFLQRCLGSFLENVSGWGLDYLWSSWASPYKAGIIDACCVRHTRPVGGPNYQFVKAQGKSASGELVDLLKKYGLSPTTAIFGGIDDTGRQLLLTQGHGCELIETILRGYLPALANFSRVLSDLLRPILKYMTLAPAGVMGAPPAPSNVPARPAQDPPARTA
jgi:hypothetical protein